MGNVKELKPGNKELRHLDGREEIIKRLKKALEMAEKGEILAVAIACQLNDTEGSISTSFGFAKKGNMWMLSGAITDLQQQVLNEGSDAEYDDKDIGP